MQVVLDALRWTIELNIGVKFRGIVTSHTELEYTVHDGIGSTRRTLLKGLLSSLAVMVIAQPAAPATACIGDGYQTIEPLIPPEGFYTTTITQYDSNGRQISFSQRTERVATIRVRTYDAAGRIICIQER